MIDSPTPSDSPSGHFIRVPASSANVGAGFDVFGMALDLFVDIGEGEPPPHGRDLDEHHPATVAHSRSGGSGPLWMRCSIPMGRGLGFSGAVRVGGAALAVVQAGAYERAAIDQNKREILRVGADLEGHGDNVAASMYGGIVASVGRAAYPLTVGPVLAAARVVVWIPDVTTSTDKSRSSLTKLISRDSAVHNLGRVAQFVLAVEHDDPDLLAGATEDRLHQAERLVTVPGASEALGAGTAAGAWCGWLSGSGPTVAFMCSASVAPIVVSAMPPSGHCKTLAIATEGARLEGGPIRASTST